MDLDIENQVCPNQRRVIHVFLLFIFLWQSLYRISDAAVSLVLKFMVKFLSLIGSCLGVEALYRLSQKFPHTLYRAKKFLGRLQERFVRYTSCPTCHKLYAKDDCFRTDHRGRKYPCSCSYVRYPMHIQARMRAPCGSLLLKTLMAQNTWHHLKLTVTRALLEA